jgi:transposase InsO family protein
MCLQKTVSNYLTDVTHPKCILSDNWAQFANPVGRKRLAGFGIEVKFSTVRRPQPNPSERSMKEIGKFCRIYCFETHRTWPEMLAIIEKWLNNTMADSTVLFAGRANVRVAAEFLQSILAEGLGSITTSRKLAI